MRKKITKDINKLFIYTANAVNLLSENEKEYKEQWLEIQKSSSKEGTFVYAWKIYSIQKDLGSDEEYVCEIVSFKHKKYLVKRNGEILIAE